jgi:molecular chaperone GrpE
VTPDPEASSETSAPAATEGAEVDGAAPPAADGSGEAEDPLGPPAGPPSGADPGFDAESASVEELITVLERATAERDEYLDALRRTQADFENYRKRSARQVAHDSARAVADLVEKVLPVLDACDAAVHHGATEVEPIYAALLGTLEKEGLVRVDPEGEAFDPHHHEAVMHEPAEPGEEGTVVLDVMRAGYTWHGRVIRPAMVKVRG